MRREEMVPPLSLAVELFLLLFERVEKVWEVWWCSLVQRMRQWSKMESLKGTLARGIKSGQGKAREGSESESEECPVWDRQRRIT